MDAVANAILDGNIDEVLARLEYFDIACVGTAEGIGHPPLCLEGEPIGTLVRVFHLAGEVPWERAPEAIIDRTVRATIGLFAIAEGPSQTLPSDVPDVEQIIIFAQTGSTGDECGYSVDVSGGLITSIDLGSQCSPPAHFLARYGEQLDLIVPPQ